MIAKVLISQLRRIILAYVDDIVVKSTKRSEHIRGLAETFANLRAANFKLNPEKCVFGIQRGKVLGSLVSTKGIEANPDKIKAITEMEEPRSVKDVQKLTGRVAALNRFISRSVERSLPFFQALRSSKEFQWGEQQSKAFKELRNYLTNMTKVCPPEPKITTTTLSTCLKFRNERRTYSRKRGRGKAKIDPSIFCFRGPIWFETILLRTRENSLCSNHGCKKAKALLRRS